MWRGPLGEAALSRWLVSEKDELPPIRPIIRSGRTDTAGGRVMSIKGQHEGRSKNRAQ